jgi:hypothetical protein
VATSDSATLAEVLLSREAFRRQQPEKQPMMPTEFNSRIKEAEAAIVALDTDAYDMRQRMEPFLDNPRLNQAQQERVRVMRAKLLKVLIEHGFVDAWGVAVHEAETHGDDTQV